MAADSEIYALTPTEIARGFLVGTEGSLPAARDRSLDPRRALERVVLEALNRPPCGVAFSGGRDSSVVLAVAVHVARREGLPDPIPLTRRFPGLEESDEDSWQELVVRHLGISDWQRLDFADELDIVGPYAQRHLRRYGLVWPAAIATTVPLLEPLAGGTLLDGEGGDDVLGYENHRIGPAAHLLRHPRAISRRALRHAAADVAFAPLRHRVNLRRRRADEFEWLRPAAGQAFAADLARDRTERPLSFAAAVRALWRRRILRVGARNRSVLARDHGVERVSPLLDPEFIHATAREGGFLGPGDRATVIRRLVGDLLPTALAERRDKATFNRAYIGAYSRSFAEAWDGTGVDLDLVDPDGLRAAWLSDVPHFMTALLLQDAWLTAHRRGPAAPI